MGFLDELNKVLEVKPVAPELAVSLPAPVLSGDGSEYVTQPEPEFDEPDPNAPPLPYDPFRDAIEAALTAEGVDVSLELRRRYDPAAGNTQTHDWESQREALFSDEKYQFKCARCSKWVHVGRDETMSQAMAEQDVDPNCASVVINDIMTM